MSETYNGYIDTTLGTFVSGWAADFTDLGRTVEVEVYVNGQLSTVAPANRYRQDLLDRGVGDGCHAFETVLPSGSITTPELEVSARVRDSEFQLNCGTGKSTRVDAGVFLRFIAADIVNNCNLRCPFCLVDYSGVRKTELMTEETFALMLPLLDCVPEQGFWLSCLHEPTLHPGLSRLLDMVPRESRKKVQFTTNLARKLPESEFVKWAESGIHHINISLDSLNAEVFEVLRKPARFKVFLQNLETLAEIFRQYPDAPRLRYITMAFQCNLAEIQHIVEQTHQKYLSTENEIRYTYNSRHITDEFRHSNYLRKEDWLALSRLVEQLPYRCSVALPPEHAYVETDPPANYFEIEGVAGPVHPVQYPLTLRGRHDGTLMVVDHEQRFVVNVHTSPDPVSYFRAIAAG